ncbi:iron-containing alcohol dehydrogenase [Lacisediminihabitans profunda]|nr:iron-containing alcohol dehydrogenase [Lacisediminihabitans profunda]
MTDTANGLLRLPAQIAFGLNSLDGLAGTVSALGRRAFVVVDPFIRGTALFGEAMESLSAAGVEVAICSEVVAELPVPAVEAAGEMARAFAPDVVVGYGGGSAIDLAKLVALLARQPSPLSLYYGENKVGADVAPLVAVPTTAGTGSEATPVAVVSDSERELKVGVSSPYLVPRAAIVDPRLSLGAPGTVTAYAGIDALVHAIESFTAAPWSAAWGDTLPVFVGRNRLSSLLALEAASTILGSLRTAVSSPLDLPAREAMSYGSLLAGMAFGGAGTHLSHALQYPIGALSKTPHGLGTGLLLPYVMEAAFAETMPELAAIAVACGHRGGSDEALAMQAIDDVRSLSKDIGIPNTLAEIGITAGQLPRIAELSLTVKRLANNSTLEPTHDLFMTILEAALTGDRSRLSR